jgi:hypothetical protein
MGANRTIPLEHLADKYPRYASLPYTKMKMLYYL